MTRTATGDESVRLEVADRVARITLAAPERHNALGAADVRRLRSILDDVEADDGSVRSC